MRNILLVFIFVFIGVVFYFLGREVELKRKEDNGYLTDEEFRHLFWQHTQRLSGHSLNSIADALLVSRPTVSRWMKGTNLPHGALRHSIIKQLSDIKE